MHQDKYNCLWFGTYDGLNLYNGKDVDILRFEFDNAHSLLGNSIYSIIDAEDSYLWVTTQLGVNKFSLKDRKVVGSFPDYKKVELIASDSKGNAWIVNKEDHLSYYDIRSNVFENIYMQGININDVKEIFINEEEGLSLIMSSGSILNVTVEDVKDKVGFEHVLKVKEKALHEKKIELAFFEKEIIYFVDKDMYLFMYNIPNQQRILIKNIADLIDRYGNMSNVTFFQHDIFLTFPHNGLVKLNLSDHYSSEVINAENGIFCVLKDRNQDVLWVGTDGQGVELYYREEDIFGDIMLSSLPFSSKKPIRAFYTDEENSLWFGTKGDGVIRIKDYEQFNHAKKIPASHVQHFVTNEGLYENPVFCFERSKYSNDLWIGTNGGISYYSYKENKMHIVEDLNDGKPIQYIHSLCEINDSTLWIATVGGGIRQIIIDKTTKPYKVKGKYSHFFRKDDSLCDEFYSMIYDGDSTLTIGSRGGYGVVCFNIYDKKYDFISMNNADNKAIGDVLCVYRSKDSVLYIGASSGLTAIKMFPDKENKIKQFNRKDGIVNDMIHGILEDNTGIIWLSTNKGLVKYNPQNDAFYNYYSPNIKVVEFSDDAYWHCPITDRLFFGGINGLVWIDPKQKTETEVYAPDLLFFSLNILEEQQMLYDYNDGEKELKLPAANNTFSISFTVLDYINGDNYDFSYMLENHNSNWISLQKANKINFVDLPYGNYVLKVKYKNDVISTDNKIYSLPITILPPWYLSYWAYGLYFILFMVLMYVSLLYVKKKFIQRQRLVTEKIKEEQKEKLLESKLRFFTNVTHELFTPLTLINGTCEQIIKYDDDMTFDPQVKKYLKILKNNLSNLNELVQEIIDFRKVEESETNTTIIRSLPVSEIIKNQLVSFEEVIEQNKIKIKAAIPDNIYWNTDRSCFKKIISNLISNAFKYTNETGNIDISLYPEGDVLKIIFYNTGKGIAPDKIPYIFDRYSILENMEVNAYNQMTSRNGLGLFICLSMVKQLQGEINVDSEEGRYVKFTVTLPKLPLTEPEQESKDSKTPVVPINTDKDSLEKRILVLDDNKDIVELVSDVLSPQYKVIKSYSAKEALSILQSYQPALIITDVMMPEMDGLSFINKIRQDKYTKHIPVVIISAKTNDKAQVAGYKQGADAYLVKPFSSEVLLSVVDRLLESKGELKDYLRSPESAFEYSDGLLIHQEDKEFIDSVLNVIKEHIENESLKLEFIAEKLNTSSRNLYRQIKRILSVSPSDFIKEYRFSLAAQLLVSTNLTVQEIIYKVGISNKSYFYKEFHKKYNLSPKEYRSVNKIHGEQ